MYHSPASEDGGRQPTDSPMAERISVLNEAHHVSIRDSVLSITTNARSDKRTTLQILYDRVSPNAISNEGGRADDVKCHPGTREEVINVLEKWMFAAGNDRVLWLTGPAGAGKTAIIKTVVERCSKARGVCTINFFFFRGDASRNGVQPVIPTLVYQLLELYPHAYDDVVRLLTMRSRILDMSVTEQCKIISVLARSIQESSPPGALVFIFIDGLDECGSNADRSQTGILCALERLVTEDDSPFRLIVASRPEPRIKMAFNELPSNAQTIFLDEEYYPERDIRLYVTAEFDRIKKTHPSASLLPHDWPPLPDIESIVKKSSGQFIYAATVMRYIAHPSTVPSLSLERVKGVAPVAKNSPFTNLDSIYVFILAQADDPDATRDMLSMTYLQTNLLAGTPLGDLLRHYDERYTRPLMESCISELSAIVHLTADMNLRFYHASLPEFLVDRARSGTYYIDVDAFRAKFLLAIWEKPEIETKAYKRNLQLSLLGELRAPNPQVTHLLLKQPFPEWTMETVSLLYPTPHLSGGRFLAAVQALYFEDETATYKRICRRFICSVLSHGLHPEVENIRYGRKYFLLNNWRYKVWNVVSGRGQRRAERVDSVDF